ncbi:BamA/TamA family outer membrane protein [Salinisphaera hydrothermalis]|uniref:BamA/TamA family outer membrane protein n=1 Tax=Salinisphaera hydrothermalis TaxID=563188 RepID=UPI00334110E1
MNTLATAPDVADRPMRWRQRGTVAGRGLACCALGFGLSWAVASPAYAGGTLDIERSVGQFIVLDNERRAVKENKAAAAGQEGQAQPGDSEAANALDSSHNVALLPQLGYDPEVGFIVGGKFSDINFGDTHMNLDIGATQSTGGETSVDGTWGVPHLFGSDFIGLVRFEYELRPTTDFYGLGNNNVGDKELSQHEYHATSLLFTLARRLAPHWVAAGTIGYDRTTVGPGDPQHGKLATTDAFSKLPGIKGGYNNPLSLSIIYNTQRDLTRPQQGWNVVGKVTHVGPELGNDFNYARFTGDASYVHPIGSPKHLIGFRIDGQYLTGSGNDLPFYEFSSIGGFDSLEGFYPNRFLGQSRIFARVGYQQLLADFQFRNLWRVRLDGTVFGGAGRVFLDKSRLPSDLLADTPQVAPGLSNDIQFSYGAGLRVALGEAISARLEAGFSGESKGLVYLSFGNAF